MSLAAQITPTGMVVPTYETILASLIASFQGIFGADIYLGNDSQDFQMIAIFAAAINDANQTALAVYNAFSPATAQGAGLSSVVKINGLQRNVSSNSTVAVTIVGQAGSVISGGIVADTVANNQWALPASVTIPIGGSITVTATAVNSGAITAAPGTVTKIVTPTLGWQTVTNAAAAVPGAPVEVDSALRTRQSVSTALPSLSVLDGMIGAVGNIPGVGRYRVYENDTASADANGAPARSTYAVVEGGNAQTIGNTIALKKTPGSPTYGTTAVNVVDSAGMPSVINFYILAEVPITVQIAITALAGYVSSTGTAVVAALVAALTGTAIGTNAYLARLYAAANLNNGPLSLTYNITSLKIARGVATPTAADVVIAFNEAATVATSNITLTVS